MQERYLGSTDQGLSTEGRIELEKLWKGRGLDFDKLYVSPMKRCVETAGIIFPERVFTLEPDFRERGFGRFEGKRYEDIKDDPEYLNFSTLKGRGAITGGEDYNCFDFRIKRGVENLVADMMSLKAEKCCVICHGGVIMHLLSNYSAHGGEIFDYRTENGRGYVTKFDLKDKLFYIDDKL